MQAPLMLTLLAMLIHILEKELLWMAPYLVIVLYHLLRLQDILDVQHFIMVFLIIGLTNLQKMLGNGAQPALVDLY